MNPSLLQIQVCGLYETPTSDRSCDSVLKLTGSKICPNIVKGPFGGTGGAGGSQAELDDPSRFGLALGLP